MKRIAIALLAGVGAIANIGGAFAASLTIEPPPSTSSRSTMPSPPSTFLPSTVTPPPFNNWGGPFVVVSGGFGWGRSNQTDKGVLLPFGGGEEGIGDGSFNMSGGLVGGDGGYNWQFYQWVFGLETDYSWADISGSSNGCGAFVAHTCSTELDSLGSFRGRIGYALGADGTWLLYGTGGLAYGELKGSDSLFNTSGSKFRTGWTVGAGIEKAIAPHWTVKGEWLYVNLGHAVLFDAAPGIPETASFTANVFRGGVTYKFF
jgi:outer membrane immunogenic protein